MTHVPKRGVCLTLIKIGVDNVYNTAYIFSITAIWQIEDTL